MSSSGTSKRRSSRDSKRRRRKSKDQVDVLSGDELSMVYSVDGHSVDTRESSPKPSRRDRSKGRSRSPKGSGVSKTRRKKERVKRDRSADTSDDIETGSVSGRSNRSKQSIQEQKFGLDEAYLMYSRAESAALMIQRKFRARHPEFAKDMEKRNSEHTDEMDYILEKEKEEEEEKPSASQMLTWIFIVCVTLVPMLVTWCGKCLNLCRKVSGEGVDDGGVNNIAGDGAGANAGGGGGGGGGGGNGPSP